MNEEVSANLMSNKEVTPASDYADKLRIWLYNYSMAQHWNNMHNYQLYQSYLAYNCYHMSIFQNQKSNITSPNTFTTVNTFNPLTHSQNLIINRGHIYKVGSISKRFFAETIDFLVLLLIKILITYLFASYFDIIDINTNKFEAVFSADISIEATLNMTSELLMLELVHRILVCFIEALYTRRGFNGVGGATPGKILFGLRIISCESIDLVPGEVEKYLIIPATDIGFPKALLRSFFKNFSIALMFPTFASIIMNPQRRAVYDVVCKTIVVENNV